MMRARASRVCRNPKCGDWVSAYHRMPICASCRLAGKCGAAAAFIAVFLFQLLERVHWLALTKTVLGAIFYR
jgi:hypothetical protein